MKKILCLLLVLAMALSLAACGAEQEATEDTAAADDAAAETATEDTAEAEEATDDAEAADDAAEEVDPASITGEISVAHHRTDLEPQVTELVESFNAIYPNIKVNLEFGAGYEETIGVRVTGGEAPDVFELGFTQLQKEYWPEYLVSEDELGYTAENIALYDNYLVDGVHYGFTEDTSYEGFFYNKDLYEQAGITESPTTPDEVVAAMEKLAAIDGIIPLTSQYKTTWAVGKWIGDYGNIFDGNGNLLNWAAEGDNPWLGEGAIGGLNLFKTLVDKDLVDPDLMSSDWDLQMADFAAGTIATYLAGSYINGSMTSQGYPADRFGCYGIPNPDGSGETATIVGGDYAMVISKQCEDVEAAYIFVDYYYRNFCEVAAAPSPFLDTECSIPCIAELLSTNPTLVGSVTNNDEATAINSIFAVSNGQVVQEYVVADDTQAVIDKYNEQWAAAKAEYLAA